MFYVFFFFFKQKTAYEMLRSLVGSEMCIRDRYQYSPRSITSRDDTASSAVTTSTPLLRASPTNYHTTESPTEIIPHGTTYTTATTNNQNHNATADTTTVTHQPPPYQRIHIPPVFSFTPAGNDPSVSSTFQTMVAYFATLGQCHHSHSSSSSFPSNTSEDNHTASPTHKCYGVPRWNGSKGILGIHLPPAFFATHNLRLAEGSAPVSYTHLTLPTKRIV
eukprot:TRINITY_DN9929_c0_g1_i2.p1 TRINITY_DN9929_c0_g1~~TRINITY_DN9929_c0_g1_i2.p1  ORF type:complete len:220 (+),score=49.37 TRINITY_DN9929_c0_g1_i2:124-783(+)